MIIRELMVKRTGLFMSGSFIRSSVLGLGLKMYESIKVQRILPLIINIKIKKFGNVTRFLTLMKTGRLSFLLLFVCRNTSYFEKVMMNQVIDQDSERFYLVWTDSLSG